MLFVVAAADIEAAYIVGDTIADFTLYDAYGTPVSLFDYENMVVWLVFWTDT
jgi:peroxiredoxin